jgi:integral membrane protein (TIGR01906 family)
VRILLSLATAIIILAVALVVLLTPVWTHFAHSLSYYAGDTMCTFPSDRALCYGLSGADVVAVSDQTVHSLIFSGDFSFIGPENVSHGQPFYTEAEQSHMRDVRVVLFGFMGLAIISAAFVVASLIRAPRDAAHWAAIGRGGIWLIVTMAVLGVFALVAFDTVFTLFHEIFFPGGNWSFAVDSHLILTYNEVFWELCSAGLFGLSVLGATIVWVLAHARVEMLGTAEGGRA